MFDFDNVRSATFALPADPTTIAGRFEETSPRILPPELIDFGLFLHDVSHDAVVADDLAAAKHFLGGGVTISGADTDEKKVKAIYEGLKATLFPPPQDTHFCLQIESWMVGLFYLAVATPHSGDSYVRGLVLGVAHAHQHDPKPPSKVQLRMLFFANNADKAPLAEGSHAAHLSEHQTALGVALSAHNDCPLKANSLDKRKSTCADSYVHKLASANQYALKWYCPIPNNKPDAVPDAAHCFDLATLYQTDPHAQAFLQATLQTNPQARVYDASTLHDILFPPRGTRPKRALAGAALPAHAHAGGGGGGVPVVVAGGHAAGGNLGPDGGALQPAAGGGK